MSFSNLCASTYPVYLHCEQTLLFLTSFVLSFGLMLNGWLFSGWNFRLLACFVQISLYKTLVPKNNMLAYVIGNLEVHICCWRIQRFLLCFLNTYVKKNTLNMCFIQGRLYCISCEVHICIIISFMFRFKFHVMRIFRFLLQH